jgi:hypothetical protein
VFKLSDLARAKPRIDLETIRETLLYIESDCRENAGLERVAAALTEAIDEIERLEALNGPKHKAEPFYAHFVPAGF